MTEMTIEQRLAVIEHQLRIAQTSGLLALRLWYDGTADRIDRGELTIEQARDQLFAAATEVGEGMPHLTEDALLAAQAYSNHLSRRFGGG